MFSDYTTAMNATLALNVIVGTVLAVVSWMMRLIGAMPEFGVSHFRCLEPFLPSNQFPSYGRRIFTCHFSHEIGDWPLMHPH